MYAISTPLFLVAGKATIMDKSVETLYRNRSPLLGACNSHNKPMQHGYKYIQARRKGILPLADHESRLKFARGIKREYSSSLWTEQVSFYLDGVSFVHKYKPADLARSTQGRIWLKPEEGLSIGCTTKGSHCGSGGRIAKFMVAIT